MPKKGRVGKLGLGGLLSGPGRGEMVIPPVSEERVQRHITIARSSLAG